MLLVKRTNRQKPRLAAVQRRPAGKIFHLVVEKFRQVIHEKKRNLVYENTVQTGQQEKEETASVITTAMDAHTTQNKN